MGAYEWPTAEEISQVRRVIVEMSGKSPEEIRVVVSPYRICPLGAHIDHQGGNVSAMTINKGILLGFTPSNDNEVVLRSGQFKGEVKFRVNEIHHPNQTLTVNDNTKANGPNKAEEAHWGNYARGAAYALQSRGNHLVKGITGYITGSDGLDSSGLSSSAAVGIAYLLALESANNLNVSPSENIEYDRLIENEYLGLRNGILDQSAILLSSYGCLTYMNCKTKEHKLLQPPKLLENHTTEFVNGYKILLAFSGLKQNLTTNPGYNRRVSECQEAARTLLDASGNEKLEPFLSNVHPDAYQAHKGKLNTNLAKRAKHFFFENMRVTKGLEAWGLGNLKDFGKLISASGLSSIENYECGAEPLIQMYNILLRAPGVFGARFSGAGFRGCCLAFVEAKHAQEAATFVREEYAKAQPQLSGCMKKDNMVLICEHGDCARLI